MVFKDLLDGNENLCTAIRALGLVRKLSLGRTESREVAEQIARGTGVTKLTVTWNRTVFEMAEEDLQWGWNRWTLDPSFLKAQKDLRAI